MNRNGDVLTAEERPTGSRASLRDLGQTLVSLVQNRLELLAVEFQEEKAWALRTVIWTAAAMTFAVLFAVMLSITLVLITAPAYRLSVLIGITVMYLAGTLGSGVLARRHFRQRNLPFRDSIAELQKDIRSFSCDD